MPGINMRHNFWRRGQFSRDRLGFGLVCLIERERREERIERRESPSFVLNNAKAKIQSEKRKERGRPGGVGADQSILPAPESSSSCTLCIQDNPTKQDVGLLAEGRPEPG
jgi:hypothetical protein